MSERKLNSRKIAPRKPSGEHAWDVKIPHPPEDPENAQRRRDDNIKRERLIGNIAGYIRQNGSKDPKAIFKYLKENDQLPCGFTEEMLENRMHDQLYKIEALVNRGDGEIEH